MKNQAVFHGLEIQAPSFYQNCNAYNLNLSELLQNRIIMINQRYLL